MQCHKRVWICCNQAHIFKDATTIRKISIIIKKCRVHHNNSRSKTLSDEIKITELVYLILQGLCEHNLWNAREPARGNFDTGICTQSKTINYTAI